MVVAIGETSVEDGDHFLFLSNTSLDSVHLETHGIAKFPAGPENRFRKTESLVSRLIGGGGHDGCEHAGRRYYCVLVLSIGHVNRKWIWKVNVTNLYCLFISSIYSWIVLRNESAHKHNLTWIMLFIQVWKVQIFDLFKFFVILSLNLNRHACPLLIPRGHASTSRFRCLMQS
jgi:hypothetical protein